MPFSPETCSADLLRGVKRLADEHGTGLTLHHGSGPEARRESLARHGLRPTEYLESLGRARAERAAGARASASTTPRSTAWPGPARPWRCARSWPPRRAGGIAAARPDAGAAGEGRPRGARLRLPEQLEPPRHGAHHEHGGPPVQGRPPGPAPDPGRDGARDGHAHRARRRSGWATSSARSSPASRPTWSCSTPSGRSGRPCSTRSTTWSTTPTAAACTR